MKNEDLIGSNVGISIVQLLDTGLNITKLEFVGFSLGAQMAGSAARYIKFYSLDHFVVPRIIGLEPAILCDPNLEAGDAAQVVTVHTGNIFSEPTVKGDVAFWVNGGVQQPMCTSVAGSKYQL